jgi:hypothetical protein
MRAFAYFGRRTSPAKDAVTSSWMFVHCLGGSCLALDL